MNNTRALVTAYHLIIEFYLESFMTQHKFHPVIATYKEMELFLAVRDWQWNEDRELFFNTTTGVHYKYNEQSAMEAS